MQIKFMAHILHVKRSTNYDSRKLGPCVENLGIANAEIQTTEIHVIQQLDNQTMMFTIWRNETVDLTVQSQNELKHE